MLCQPRLSANVQHFLQVLHPVCPQAQPFACLGKFIIMQRRGAGQGRTGSSKASSASLLQRLLRRSCSAPGPPAWKGERPGRPAPLLRARRKMLSAKEPQGDTPLGGDLRSTRQHHKNALANRKRWLCADICAH